VELEDLMRRNNGKEKKKIYYIIGEIRLTIRKKTYNIYVGYTIDIDVILEQFV
jgi:hypothetical protein